MNGVEGVTDGVTDEKVPQAAPGGHQAWQVNDII